MRRSPLKRLRRKFPTVFAQPKISSTRFRRRCEMAYPRCPLVRRSMAVGAHSDSPTTRQCIFEHGQRRHAFGGAGGLADAQVHQETVPVLHQRVRRVGQLRRLAFGLLIERLGIRGRDVRLVAALLAAEVDAGVRGATECLPPSAYISSKSADMSFRAASASFLIPRIGWLWGTKSSGERRTSIDVCWEARPRMPPVRSNWAASSIPAEPNFNSLLGREF